MPRGSAHGKLTAGVEPTRPSAVAVGGRNAVRQAAAQVAHGPVALLDKRDSACEDAQNRPIGALIAAKRPAVGRTYTQGAGIVSDMQASA